MDNHWCGSEDGLRFQKDEETKFQLDLAEYTQGTQEETREIIGLCPPETYHRWIRNGLVL